jgi:hypothetical protein
VQNYINYFTEVEERFQQRRGSLLLLSTLDWALIESWRDAGVPLEAVIRGIDDAFDKHETRKAKGRSRRVNGLSWCTQAVMGAAETMREAATGMAPPTGFEEKTGFEGERIARHLDECRDQLLTAPVSDSVRGLTHEIAARLGVLAAEARAQSPSPEALELTLRTLEQKLLAMLLASSPEDELAALRQQAAREIAPYKSRMQALQIRQIEQQFLEKRLLEKYTVPRLSLFYMRSDG